MAQNNQNYYSNPAFCQQSEFYDYDNRKQCSKGISPQRKQNGIRQSPVGAQSPVRVVDNVIQFLQGSDNNENYEEQDFYEEMLVDHAGFVKQKKIVVLPATNDVGRNGNYPSRYACVPPTHQSPTRMAEDVRIVRSPPSQQHQQKQQQNGHRYAVVPVTDEQLSPNNSRYQKNRYEYIPAQNQRISPKKGSHPRQEEYELEQRRIVHRYAVIPAEEETEITATSHGRYEAIQENSKQSYRYSTVPNNDQSRRYEYIEDAMENYDQSHHQWRQNENPESIKRVTSPTLVRRPPNPQATQKLHELLTTPKKTQKMSHSLTPQKITLPQSPRRPISPAASSDPFVTTLNRTPRKITREKTPKAQQKLNYALSTQQPNQDKRYTAIVSPICSSPVQSVYSETTFSNKSESWMNVSGNKQPVHATLTVAAVMMLLCGGLASSLCFYMVSFMGRLYFLDFGIVSGFACLVLGVLGFRSRNHYYWLPNRNYMSGYIILTLFSLLTCVGLLVLLFMQPKPGSPLADMTSGAVCGISVLSLILATAGVMSSYCCKLPPPDNRVEHCARGFTV